MAMTGGVSNVKAADAEVQKICDAVRPQVHEKLSRELDVYEAVQFTTQVVAGMNYFVKVHVGNQEYIHVRIYQPLPPNHETREVHSLQHGKAQGDALEYF